MVVVDGAFPQRLSLKGTTMIILGIFASLTAVVVFCWLLFYLAIHALPVFTGFGFASLARLTGAGVPGTIIIGLTAAVIAFAIGQAILANSGNPRMRSVTMLAFVASAAFAGFEATHGIALHAVSSTAIQVLISCIGGLVVGRAAFCRLQQGRPTT